MDHTTPPPMTPFDELTSSGELQMLKLLLPYTPPGVQRMLACYIRFTELQNTIRYFSTISGTFQENPFHKETPSFSELLEELLPYIGKDMQDMAQNLSSAMSMMEMMKDMDLSDLFGTGTDQAADEPEKKGWNEDGNGLDESPRNEEHGSG